MCGESEEPSEAERVFAKRFGPHLLWKRIKDADEDHPVSYATPSYAFDDEPDNWKRRF